MNDILIHAQSLIDQAFAEDLGERGDITSRAIDSNDKPAYAEIIAKQSGIVAGLDIVKNVFLQMDDTLSIDILCKDGDTVENKQTLVRIHGNASFILQAERTALNFLGKLSGIATLTGVFVDAVKGTNAKILDTRKTTPGWRTLEKYAVTCGGGENHRIGLYDMFLLKENHILKAGGIRNAVSACREYMKKNKFSAPIEVETQNLQEVQQAAKLDVDRIMLDNMTLVEMQACVHSVQGKVALEASGNVSLESIVDIAKTGVDYISIGSLTHSVPVFDASLLFRVTE